MYTCQKADEYIEKNRVDRADKPEFHLTTPGGLVKRSKWVFHIWRKGTFDFTSSIHTARSWGPMHLGTFHLR